MADHEKVYSVRFDVAKAQAALGKFNKRLERSIKLVSKLEHTGKRTFRAFAQGYKKMERGAERVNRSTRKIGKTALNASKQIEKAARRSNKGFDRMGTRVAALGSTLTRRLTLPLGIAGIASMKFARDMNKGMALIATLIPGQTERVKKLKEEIQGLATETGVSTGDLTEGVYAAISAWSDSADTIDRVRVAAQAAQAGNATTADTLGLLTSLTEIYGDNSAEAVEHVADLAFVTNKLAIKAPIGEMAVSMGRVAPLANQLNVSMEEMFATLTAGAGVTGTVSEVATQMSSLYTAVIKETPAMSSAVAKSNKELGTSYKTAADMLGKMGTVKFLTQLEKLSKGDTKKFAKILGGRKEGLVLALSLLGGRAEKYNEALTEMETKTGQMKIAHREITEGIDKEGFAWDRTVQKMKVFSQKIGDKLLPVLSKLLDAMEPIFKALEKMDEGTLEWGIKLAGLLMVIGPGLKIFGSLATVFGAIKVGALGIMGTSAGMSSFFTTQGANAATLTTKMGLLAKSLGAVALAAGAGYAVGTVISEKFVEPYAKKKYDEQWNFDDQIRNAREAARTGTTAQRGSAMANLEKMQAAASSAESSIFDESPFQKTIQLAKIKALRQQLNEANPIVPSLDKDFATQSVMGGGSTSSVINNVTINAPKGEAKAYALEVEKVLTKKIQRGAAGIGASEQ